MWVHPGRSVTQHLLDPSDVPLISSVNFSEGNRFAIYESFNAGYVPRYPPCMGRGTRHDRDVQTGKNGIDIEYSKRPNESDEIHL